MKKGGITKTLSVTFAAFILIFFVDLGLSIAEQKQKIVDENAAVIEAMVKEFLQKVYGDDFIVYKYHRLDPGTGLLSVSVTVPGEGGQEELPDAIWITPDGRLLIDGSIYNASGKQLGGGIAQANQEYPENSKQKLGADKLDSTQEDFDADQFFRRLVEEEIRSSGLLPSFPDDAKFFEKLHTQTKAVILNPAGSKGILSLFIVVDCDQCTIAINELIDLQKSGVLEAAGIRVRIIPVLLSPEKHFDQNKYETHIKRSALFLQNKGKLPLSASQGAMPSGVALEKEISQVKANQAFFEQMFPDPQTGVPMLIWQGPSGSTQGMFGYPVGYGNDLMQIVSQNKSLFDLVFKISAEQMGALGLP